jgi:phenylalanyl-tRNA synthetase beta chain
MKVSLNWLRELVALPPTVDELVSLLTLAGVEVEGIATTGCAIANVVVAEIKSSEQHPNADRLSVCQVEDGSGTPRQIVCGAKNYRVGDKVPLALPGAQLAPDFKIKVGKLRGVESQGMLCSAEELQLSPTLGARGAEDGLLILPPEAQPGTPISELFPGDTVLDLEITPNRPDLLSLIGIAREVAALTGQPWQAGQLLADATDTAENSVAVTSPACLVYTVRQITGVRVGPSPDWLRTKLTAAGLRSINNVVDITNFVMLETGQPLHAFDADKLAGALAVRTARAGESFLALDGQTYQLTPEHLVIADARKAVALGGIMGGEETGVTEKTVNLWLESAHFQPQSIRRTARALGLSSDSSYRFERGVDPAGVIRASARATALILELAGGQAGSLHCGFPENSPLAGQATVKLGGDAPTHHVPLRPARASALLGVAVPESRIDQILTSFGLAKDGSGWRVPSFRPDLTREVDLIEEIARVVGMDAIPARTQARFVAASASDKKIDREMALRRALVAHGFHEARSLTLVPAEPLGLAFTRATPGDLLRVKNPMIDDQVLLRPNLLHGLLSALRENRRAGATSVRLFEIGRVFAQGQPEESTHAALVLSGVSNPRTWRSSEGRACDLFDLYGVLESALGATCRADQNDALALCAVIEVNGKPVGSAGQLWPAAARALEATAPVLFAEIDLAALTQAEGATRKYREIPRFPAASRDIALLAPLALAHAEIERALLAAKEPLLTGIELFDVFTDATGAKIPADRKSLAYSLTYRAADRTLTAEEVNAAHAKVKAQLTPLGVALRE